MNWGKGIGIFLALFIVFISTLAIILMRANADLVSEDYYLKEINYGDEITAYENAKKAGAELFTEIKESGVLIQVKNSTVTPDEIAVHLLRGNNPDQDIHKKETGSSIFISRDEFQNGKYTLTVYWQNEETQFQLKDELWIP
jgi:hypothetical protein